MSLLGAGAWGLRRILRAQGFAPCGLQRANGRGESYQVITAGRFIYAKCLDADDLGGVISEVIVDLDLLNGLPNGIAQEVVLRRDDDGGLGGLVDTLDTNSKLAGARRPMQHEQEGRRRKTHREDSVGKILGVGNMVHAQVEVAKRQMDMSVLFCLI